MEALSQSHVENLLFAVNLVTPLTAICAGREECSLHTKGQRGFFQQSADSVNQDVILADTLACMRKGLH